MLPSLTFTSSLPADDTVAEIIAMSTKKINTIDKKKPNIEAKRNLKNCFMFVVDVP